MGVRRPRGRMSVCLCLAVCLQCTAVQYWYACVVCVAQGEQWEQGEDARGVEGSPGPRSLYCTVPMQSSV